MFKAIKKKLLTVFSKKSIVRKYDNDIADFDGHYHLGFKKEKNGKIKYYLNVEGEYNPINSDDKEALIKLRDDLNILIRENESKKEDTRNVSNHVHSNHRRNSHRKR